MKRILVTGATGFVGSHLADKLIQEGYDVIPIGRTVKPWNPEAVTSRLVKLDLTSDSIPAFGDLDCVIHCASLINSETNNWQKYYENNCVSTLNLIRNLSVNRFIYVSSLSVFNEDYALCDKPDPEDYYGLSKYLSEKLIIIGRYKQENIILRYPIIMGVKTNNGLMSYILNNASSGEDIELYGNGNYFRNIIHISEVVMSILCAVRIQNPPPKNLTLNIGSSNSLKTYEIAENIAKAINSQSRIVKVRKKTRNDFDVFVDVSRSSVIGYTAKSGEENIVYFINECRNQQCPS